MHVTAQSPGALKLNVGVRTLESCAVCPAPAEVHVKSANTVTVNRSPSTIFRRAAHHLADLGGNVQL